MALKTVGEVLEKLEPVSLEELNIMAELQKRTDRKYILREDQAMKLLKGLYIGNLAKVLEHQGSRVSSYGSTYYDTENLRCYREALQKSRLRFKLRERAYMESNLSFLEVKRKSRRGTEKFRTPLDSTETPSQEILKEHMSFLEEVMPRSVELETLHPSLKILYKRATLTSAHNAAEPFRATIDSELSWISEAHKSYLKSRPMLILETKTPGPPSELDRRLWSEGIRPSSLSKYALGTIGFNPPTAHPKMEPSRYELRTPLKGCRFRGRSAASFLG